MKTPIQISDRFTYSKLIRFTLPAVAMMIFTSVYGVVDGFFISNFVGKTSFAAVNFIMPFLMILGTLGFMFGTGGSALISKTFGEGNPQKANRIFSLLVFVTLFCGVIISAVSILLLPSILSLLGASGEMLTECVRYGRIVLLALPTLMLQYEFHSFFAAAGKPQLGLYTTVVAGCANMILDALLTSVFRFGIAGAAAATAISQFLGGAIPFFYFIKPNSSTLRIGSTRLDWRALVKVCTNGSSELMSNISMSLVGMLYNMQLLKYAGENGVAAYGIMMYVGFIFFAIFIGYSTAVAPIVGFHFGAKNTDEVKSVKKKSFLIILCLAVFMFVSAQSLATVFASIFIDNADTALMEMTVSGFRIFSFCFLLAGFSIFGSGFFTALNDGLTSAFISFLRTVLFESAAILILPQLFGLTGVWISAVAADFMAVTVTVICLKIKQKKYQY